jgi:hypothetical protein
MDASLTDMVSASAASVTALTAIAGAIFVVRQLRSVERATRGATYERLAAQSYEVIRFLAQKPETYKYFYEDANLPDAPDSQDPTLRPFVNYATEMLANYCEYIALQRRYMSPTTWKTWLTFIEGTYQCSPVFRAFIEREGQWYADELIKIIEDIKKGKKRENPG